MSGPNYQHMADIHQEKVHIFLKSDGDLILTLYEKQNEAKFKPGCFTHFRLKQTSEGCLKYCLYWSVIWKVNKGLKMTDFGSFIISMLLFRSEY